MFLSELTVFLRCSSVLLGLVMLAEGVVVLSLMMMVCRSVVVSRCLVMVLTGWMFSCLRHWAFLR